MDIITNIINNIVQLPYGGYILLAIILIVIAVCFHFFLRCDAALTRMVHRVKPSHKRDATRVYTAQQKDLASAQCHHRCEGTGIFFRCSYRGQDLQGDHWFPHSRGGATTEKNLVMLCPSCNRKKSNHIPTALQTWGLSRRRKHHRDYSNDHISSAGEWLPRRYNSGNDALTSRNKKSTLSDRPFF